MDDSQNEGGVSIAEYAGKGAIILVGIAMLLFMVVLPLLKAVGVMH
ncbi:hypothetical protein [Methylotenera sp.]|nr:hypothetical protein [Methylotenera sp.]